MIYAAIKKREKHIVFKNKMEIKVDPRIAQALEASSFISSKLLSISSFLIASRGRSHMLIRPESEEEKPTQQLRKEIKKLKSQLEKQQKVTEEEAKNAEILHHLYESGIIDEDGNYLVKELP